MQEVVMFKALGGSIFETRKQAVEGDLVHLLCQTDAINQASAQKLVECLRNDFSYRSELLATLEDLIKEYAPAASVVEEG